MVSKGHKMSKIDNSMFGNSSHSWMTCQTQFLKRTNQGLFFLSSVRIGQVGLEKMSKVLKFTDGQQTSSDGNSSWPFGSGEQKVSCVNKLIILSDESKWEINI